MTRRRGNVFMNPAGWAYATPQGSLDGAAAPAAGGPDPAPYGSPILWSDPAQGITLSGSNVATSNDMSGNGNHIDDTVSTVGPLFVADDANFNNKPTFDFNGTSHFLQRATFVGGQLTQPTVVAMAVKLDTTTGTLTYFDGESVGRNMCRTVSINQLFAGSAVGNIGAVDTSIHLMMLLFNGALSGGWIDGTWTVASANPGTTGMNGINLGASHLGIEWLNGQMGQFTIFDGEPSTANKNGYMNELATYFNTTWTDIV